MSWFTDQAPGVNLPQNGNTGLPNYSSDPRFSSGDPSQAIIGYGGGSYLPPNGNTGFTGTGGSSYAIGDNPANLNRDFGMNGPQPATGYLGGSSTFNEGSYLPPNGNTGFTGLAGSGLQLGGQMAGSQPQGGSSYAVTGNQNDPAYIGQWLKGQGVQDKDIAYYTQKIQGVGGLGDGKWWSEQIHSTAPGAGGGAGMGAANSPLLAPYGQTFQGGGPVPQFNAPSGLDLANDPGYQARMKMGADAIQNSAAAKGKLLTGGTLKDLTQYGQDFGSNEYSNVFNRALSGYNANLTGQNQGFNQAYNTFGMNYDIFRNNQTDPFNKLYSLSNLGFNAANSANNAGNQYGNNLGQNSTSYTGIGQHSADNVGSTQIGQGNVNGAAQIQQGNNNAGYINQAGNIIGDVADNQQVRDWFKKHWFGGGGSSSGGGPTTDAGNY